MNELPSVLSFSCVGITKNIVIFGKAAVIPCLCFPYQFQCSVAVAVSAASVFLELKIFFIITYFRQLYCFWTIPTVDSTQSLYAWP